MTTNEVCEVGLCRTHRWTPAMARRRAARGARLLDRLASGWRQEVDERRLRMGDSFLCVLGQAGEHIVATLAPQEMRVLRLEDEVIDYDLVLPYVFRERFGLKQQAAEHGFTLPECIGTCHEQTAWEMLDCAWLEQLFERSRAHRAAVAEAVKVLQEVRA